jgi:hypothetical protein
MIRGNNFGLLHTSFPFLYPFSSLSSFSFFLIYLFLPSLISLFTPSILSPLPFHIILPFLSFLSNLTSVILYSFTLFFLFPCSLLYYITSNSFIPFPLLVSIILPHCTLHLFITSPFKHRIMLCIVILEVTFSNIEVLTL